MGTTADKLNKLLETKQAIKQAIIDKGVDVSDDTKFADYPAKINSIESGGGGNNELVWDAVTNNGTRGRYLFYDCYNLTSLDVSNLDTSNMTNMNSMFFNCYNLTSLDVSNWDTSNVTSMQSMFSYCDSLTSLDVSNWDTSNVKDMADMFWECHSLESLNLSNWDTSNVTTISGMFDSCESLASLNVSNWDTSNVTDMSWLFDQCYSLETIIGLDTWDVSNVTDMDGMFAHCTALTDFEAPKNISTDISVQDSSLLTHDSLMSIINNLITVTSTKTLALGAENLAKLSSEEKAIATNKGWTLA